MRRVLVRWDGLHVETREDLVGRERRVPVGRRFDCGCRTKNLRTGEYALCLFHQGMEAGIDAAIRNSGGWR